MGSRNFGASSTARRAALLAATALTLTFAAPGFAAPDACTSGGSYICSGNQSAGIDLDAPPNSLTIQGLTNAINPAAGTAGVVFQGFGANGATDGASGAAGPLLTVNSNLGALGMTTVNNSGFIVQSFGGAGAFAGFNSNPGGTGGAGGSVSLTNAGSIVVTNGNGIQAQSFAGTGGFGGVVLGFDDVPGGVGGAGGAGGAVTVTNSGTIDVTGVGTRGIFIEAFGGDGGPGGFSFAQGDAPGGISGAGGNIVVNNSGAITTNGVGSAGIFAHSAGGLFGAAGTIQITSTGAIETHGVAAIGVLSYDVGSTPLFGEEGSDINITTNISGGIVTNDSAAHGVQVFSQGGFGAEGDDDSGVDAEGGVGERGGHGGTVKLVHFGNILTKGADAVGLLAGSFGGQGGEGGDADGLDADAGDGGAGRDGRNVDLTNNGGITTQGAGAFGIFALSKGGRGGDGGDAAGVDADGGNGALGGNAGIVTIVNNGSVETHGIGAYGVVGQSLGGNGGGGGDGGGLVADGGGGSGSGQAGTVNITNTGSVITHGANAYGLFAQSIGGFSGSGGSGAGFVGFGGSGSTGGDGGKAFITNAITGSITTSGENSHAIFVQSVGGGGGDGGSGAGLAGLGSGGNSGGAGGTVGAINRGALQTFGDFSRGIFAQSVGGGGGNGGSGAGIAGFGGSGSGTSSGGIVTVTNSGSISTAGKQSQGIFAESIGGGGGDGGSGSGLVSFGGSGGAGGDGAGISVTNSGTIATLGEDSTGIFAQSVGGGGGNGGNAYAAGAQVAFAFGGSGGPGGIGGTVVVNSTGGLITTAGDRARGIQAQSVGGGGGNGGAAIAVSAGIHFSASLAFGGDGGDGGAASSVTVSNGATINTLGADAHGIFAQGVGGGGGSGGMSIAASLSNGVAANLSMGGSGGAGGDGSAIRLINIGPVTTGGYHAQGVFAQSVGGGGGDGGFAITGGIGKIAALGAAVGGSGDHGGAGSTVDLDNQGNVVTGGEASHAILAQSVGGGGGNGGFAVTGGISSNLAAGVSLGGSGDGGGDADTVTLKNTGSLKTSGFGSDGILAQSIGGGGGNAGFSIAGGLSQGVNASFALGHLATGGGGGSAGAVSLNSIGNITTAGDLSYGILAQSVGGGGGTGGFSIAGGLSTDSLGGLSFAMGGAGGSGGNASSVTVSSNGAIATTGVGSDGVRAQSIGGGGGSGGFAGAINGTLSDGVAVSVAVGGNGNGGGNGGAVAVNTKGSIQTQGVGAYGIFGQSLGGGGGDGGWSMSLALGAKESKGTAALAIGGAGGSGGISGNVAIDNEALIGTKGANASGIFAQSIGGGGGNGGMSISGVLSTGTNAKQLSLAVGGDGGAGNVAGNVSVLNKGAIATQGELAYGIDAESIGGGGGNGGMSMAGAFAGPEAKNLTLSVGGNGGTGNTGGNVDVTNSGAISTSGAFADAIRGRSVGGGGGNGGMALATVLSVSGEGTNVNLTATIGGKGGSGNTGGAVHVINSGDLATLLDNAHGIFAQSVGGGGGDGGAAISVVTGVNTADPSKAKARTINLTFAIGGGGGSGNNGGNVIVENSGDIFTAGVKSVGILAQSVGGGGGNGGRGSAVSNIFNTAKCPEGATCPPDAQKNFNVGVSIGGSGGGASDAGSVVVDNSGAIETLGVQADAIFAQSVGGGGGDGGIANPSTGVAAIDAAFTVAGLVKGGTSATKFNNFTIAVGGDAGSSGNGGTVVVTNSGAITTHGTAANGILAQSVGGGGGVGIVTPDGTEPGDGGSAAMGATGTVGIGGKGGAGGNGAGVSVTNTARIETFGDGAYGIKAQSVGGGGGVAGSVIAVQTSTIPVVGKYFDINAGLGFALGQNGGAGGNGGIVDVVSSGDILTHGGASIGIFAQSVGGGGGQAGNVATTVVDTILSGGSNFFAGSVGYSGSASDVNVSQDGDITIGGSGLGIFAQSAGGLDNAGAVNVTVNGNIANANGGGIFAQSVAVKNGGDITIAQTGNVTTAGDSAIAIQAQSLANARWNGTTKTVEYFAAPPGVLVGNSGAIAIALNGDIATSGANAHGVSAQSGTADGNSGDIDIEIRGSIHSTGADADAIVADSQGGAGNNGTITVAINSGTVSGGTGNGAAVRLRNGTDNNRITLRGTLTTEKGFNGATIVGSAFTETVDNFGTFIGGASLGAGANSFTNHAGGTLALGSNLDLGSAGNVLTNAGTLSPGGANVVYTAGVNGRLVQTAAASYALDLDFATTTTTDRVNLTGSAAVAGNVAINTLNKSEITPGTHQATIFHADGGLTNNGLTLSAAPSAVIAYSLSTPNANDAALNYTVDFTPAGVNLSGNEGAVADYISGILAAGGSDSFDPIAEHIVNIGDPNELANYYRSLISEPLLAPVVSTLFAGDFLNNAMLSCRRQDGDSFRFLDEGSCNWFQVSPRRTERESVSAGLNSDEDLVTVSAGGQVAVTENLRIGLGLGYQNSSLEVGNALRSAGNRGMGGVSLKFVSDPVLAALTVTGGFGKTETTRYVAGSIATSQQFTKFAAGQFRLAGQLANDDVYIRPMVDVAGGVAWLNGFAEQGAGPLNLIVGDTRSAYATVTPAVEIGAEIPLYGASALRPFARVGMTQFLTGDRQEVAATLQGAPAGVSPFINSTALDQRLTTISVGADLLNAGRVAARIDYSLQFGPKTRSEGVTLKFSTSW